MDASLQVESEKLARSWLRHDSAELRDYLVGGVEDPRINLQSVLSRHFLVEQVLGPRFASLMEAELRFAAALNWLRRVSTDLNTVEVRSALLHALRRGADNAEGLEIPGFLSRTFTLLPGRFGEVAVPHYLEQALAEDPASADLADRSALVLDTFQRVWADALAAEIPQGTTVLEPACGSANDYRFVDAYGIARLVDYTGFDLCAKNVENARSLFPQARFQVGNVFEIPVPDQAFELGFVHDLFEHLSPEALPVAVRELTRVIRRSLCVGFFQMHDAPEHTVRPLEEYHWNTLSRARTKALFEDAGFDVQMLHIGTYLDWRIGCAETHNANAYTFRLVRRA